MHVEDPNLFALMGLHAMSHKTNACRWPCPGLDPFYKNCLIKPSSLFPTPRGNMNTVRNIRIFKALSKGWLLFVINTVCN